MANKTEAQKLQEELTWSAPHIAKEAPEQKEQAYKYCEGYKEFLNTGKTERECVKEAVRMLKEAGYRLFDRSETYAPGDKVYFVNREKAVIGVRRKCFGQYLVFACSGRQSLLRDVSLRKE